MSVHTIWSNNSRLEARTNYKLAGNIPPHACNENILPHACNLQPHFRADQVNMGPLKFQTCNKLLLLLREGYSTDDDNGF